MRREKIETSDRNVLGQEEAEEETSMGHVTEPSIFFFFWSILDDSETLRAPQENDQTAVSKRLLDGASHARCAGDLQICRGHYSGVPGGDSDPGAGERPFKTQTARRWNRDMARLAPLPAPKWKANHILMPFTVLKAAHVRR